MLFLRLNLIAVFFSLNLPLFAQTDWDLRWYPTPDSHSMGMSVYPLPPPNTKLPEIFLPYEYPKDSAFVKLTMLEVREDATYNDLIIKIKEEGKKQGVDAIIIIDKKREFETDGSHFETLTGVGIRYIKNMNYLNKYVKWQKVYFQNSAESPVVHAVTVAYNYDSEVWKLLPEIIPHGDTVFTKYARRWSPQHLLAERDMWKYGGESDKYYPKPQFQFSVYSESFEGYKKVNTRVFYNAEGQKEKKCNLHYEEKETDIKRVNYINILYYKEKDKEGKYIGETVHFKWRDDNKIQETDIQAKNGLHFKEYFFYDTEGRLQYSSMVRVLPDKREIPFIKSMYEYFSIEDFE